MHMGKLKHWACATAFLGAVLAAPHGRADDDAQAILAKADAIRFPAESFQVEVDIVSSTDGKAQEPRKYRVLSKGNENSIVITLEPADERGQSLLMRGRDLWVFLPNVSQPVRLSLAQRLTGQVANADLARANFTGDYTATLAKTEDIGGEKHHVLELTAVDKAVPYRRVLYWVRASDFRPHKAEFFALSDRLLKTARYENYQKLGAQTRPTRVVMEDALKKSDQSVLNYKNLEVKELPDKMFTKDYLKRLEL